jgi:hypothetical protein
MGTVTCDRALRLPSHIGKSLLMSFSGMDAEAKRSTRRSFCRTVRTNEFSPVANDSVQMTANGIYWQDKKPVPHEGIGER